MGEVGDSGGYFVDFQFGLAYSFAAVIHEEVFERPENGWLLFVETDHFELEDPVFAARALKPHRDTLLHVVIKSYLRCSLEHSWRKNFDPEGVIDLVQPLLDFYEIEYVSFENYLKSCNVSGDEEDEENLSHHASEYSEELQLLFFEKCLDNLTNEVFTLLFGDRMFLKAFGEIIATQIQEGCVVDYPDLLANDGIVKRCAYWPRWLKNGVFHRDRGRCVLCQADLTGVVAVGKLELHIDHIIPLALGGTNDPTNLQCLCSKCNRTKAAATETSAKTNVYWDFRPGLC